MKKTIFASLMFATLTLSLGSCGHGDANAETDTTMSAAAIDSMSQCYGNFMGAYFSRSISTAQKYDSTEVNRKDFMQGLQLVLSQDRSSDFVAGANAGLQIVEDLKRFSEQGAKLDRAAIVALIRENVMGDTISELELSKLQKQLTDYAEQLNKKVERKNEIAATNSPQGIANARAGKAFADNFLKTHAGARRTNSGLVAAIAEQGGEPVQMDKAIRVALSLKHVDGKEIFSRESAVVMPDGQLPGIHEALSMLRKGGKGTFVLTPELAYGILGMEQIGVGPMEYVVVDLEVFENVIPGGSEPTDE